MDDTRGRDTGRLAITVGVVAAGSVACLATFFAARGPFGTLNDVGNAATGVLSAALAWRLRHEIAGRASDAQQTFNRLVEEFPDSPFSADAKKELEALKKAAA